MAGLVRALLFGLASLNVEVTTRPQPTDDPVTSRVIASRLVLRAPFGSCTVASVTGAIAKSLAIPAGVEMLPGPCTRDATESSATQVLHLQGTTVQDAMNMLVKVDPRYYWTETDGVIVVRPVEAWGNPKHFLHHILDGLELDKANIGEALHAVLGPLSPEGAPRGSGPGQVMAGVSEISLKIGPVSVIEALDAVVRAHGRMRWQVEYCKPEAVAEFAKVWFYTADDRGIGTAAASARDADGKYYDACRDSRKP